MFADHWWPNIVLFAAGQAASWYYMHTGRTRIGVASAVALWVLADWFLVAKYVFDAAGTDLLLPLASMQVVAAATAGALSFALWRRRWSAAAKQRTPAFAAAITAYMRGDLDEARSRLRRLVRTDPWDAAAWVALGNVAMRAGERWRARRCYRRALGVDTKKQFVDFVRHQSSLPVGLGAAAAPAAAEHAAADAVG